MWQYQVNVVWQKDKQAELTSGDNPSVRVGTPPEFGGPGVAWSPEQLLAGSVASCIMTTAIYSLERSKVEIQSYSSNATATLEKGRGGLVFSGINVNADLTVRGTEKEEKLAREGFQKAETVCPVSNAVECPVSVNLTLKRNE